MSITEISVKRPAAITMVIALLIGLGIFGYKSMGVDLLPAMDVPVITISTTYNGAGADDIKQDIVEPIENAVSGISGIDTLSSRSKAGVGTVVLRFNVGTDMNSVLMDVQKAVDTVQKSLPADADKPVIYKVDVNDQPVLTLALAGSSSYEELYNEACNIQTDIENLPGVAQVSLQGVDQRQLFIKLNKTAVEYYGINLNTLLIELQNNNVNMPAGLIKQDKLNQSIRVVGDFANVDEVKNLLVPTANGGKVRLADIADVKLDYPDPTTITNLNGKRTVGIVIQKQSDSNVVEVVNSIKNEMGKIKSSMPSGMNVVVANDTTVFINQSVTQVKHNLIEGIITTAIVLLFFLKSWRSSLVVLVAIPTSLISTFFMMYEFHFTLNMMSLMGLALCIGILVDDSIVVLENIQRHLSMGKNPIKAAIEGRKEIGMAAVAITLCDVVVFAPIAFMPGSMIGQMFKQFALTIVVATLFSLFVSFTVTPMLASRFFTNKTEEKKSFFSKHKDNIFVKASSKVSKFMDNSTKLYTKFLLWSLENRIKVLVAITICVVLSFALVPLKMIKTEYMPTTDQGSINLSMSLAPGSTLQETDAKIVQVEKYLHTIPEISEYFTTVGNGSDITSAQINVQLVPKANRKKSQSEIAAQIRTWGRRITGANFGVTESSQMGGFGGGSSRPIDIDISGPDDNVIKSISYEVENLVKSVPGVADTSNSARSDQAEFRVNINRLAASQYGVAVSDIASALRTAISGSQAGVYRAGDNSSNEYNVTVQFMDGQIKTPADVASIKILNSSGQQISLSQVASIIQADGPKTISRDNRQDVFTITGNLQQGAVLGTVTQDIKDKLAATTFPTGYSVSYGGSQKQMADSIGILAKTLAVSLLLVYMILVVLYESFLTPFLRLLALPCAAIGALGILAITGKTLNLMSVIGLIMLDGLASKNGTLLIDYTNTLMKRGMNLKEALIESGTTRLRPIIMTSMTMIVGMLPSAFSIGEGSETKSSMSCVIIGGMIASTLLSPIIIPIVYTLIDDFNKWMSKKRKKKSYSTEVEQYES